MSRRPSAMVRPIAGFDRVLLVVAVLQAVLGIRVAARLARTARGRRIVTVAGRPPPRGRVAVIVPTLDERRRLQPCLDGLSVQGPEVLEILVVDGGSTDGTLDLVRAHARRDARLRLVRAGPAPSGWNGKAFNLQVGVERANRSADWILTVDADVRPAAGLARAMLVYAEDQRLGVLSAATVQELSGAAEAVVHPALLATLVYRFGIPGQATTRVRHVQANGQCFLVARAALERSGGFAAVRESVCEDVTLGRRLALWGERVGFAETDGLVSVAMYAGWRDAWRNWTRSLPLRDRYWGVAGPVGLVEVLLVQAAPIPLVLVLGSLRRPRDGATSNVRIAGAVNLSLAAMRLGVLFGIGRAYRHRPWTYWLSPAADVPVALALIASATRRRHTWRGREIVRR